MLCLTTAIASGGCALFTPETKVVTLKPACQNVKPFCPLSVDVLADPSARVALRNNEAMKAMCGAKWAQCPKRTPAVMGPPAPMPRPQSVPQVEAKTS